jgi:hypothetical protein
VSAVCPSCGCIQPEGLLCNTEVLKLRADLNAVPGLVEDLAIAIAKQAKLNTGGRGSKGSAHERWAIDVDSSAEAWELESKLTKWASQIARILNYGPPTYAAALTSALLLLDEMTTVRGYEDVAQLVEEIHRAVQHATEHVLGPRERTRIPVGPCPELNPDGSHCDGDVLAYIPRQDNAPSRMQCKLNSDHKWTSIQFYRAGRRIHDRANQIRRGA